MPYIISARIVDDLVSGGPDAVARFLAQQHHTIESYWKLEGNAAVVIHAIRGLLDQIDGRLPDCLGTAKLLVLEANALLAAATPTLTVRAQDSAERALEILRRVSEPDIEVINEAVLVTSVAQKALGQPDESVSVLRTGRRDWKLDAIGGVGLERQEVMVTQDLRLHIRLLTAASDYTDHRPREYYRTLKRVMEFLLNRRAIREAAALAPEVSRAFMVALPGLSYLARLSFIKNIGQLLISTGQTDRGVRLLRLARRMSAEAGYEGQIRQIGQLLVATDAGETPRLTTYRVV